MTTRVRIGILGATGMVGQRFITLLHDHPYFEICVLAASAQSAGKTYAEAVKGRWSMSSPIPNSLSSLVVRDASSVESIAKDVDAVFCAVDMKKDETLKLEEAYAKAEIPVISNNSATRMLPDVPMLIPELNSEHLALIDTQKKRLGSRRGFIAVKPNCSIQSYVPALWPLQSYGLEDVMVTTFQAISGAGKTFESWPEMLDNVIPFTGGEEEKSEKEPLKVFGTVRGGLLIPAERPRISAQCIRVPVSNGHMASVSVRFRQKPSREAILNAWRNMPSLTLPSAPKPFLTYFEEDNRPQTKLERGLHHGMGISVGRLREDPIFDYKFVSLSHNTLCGAAGGAVLIGELLVQRGLISRN